MSVQSYIFVKIDRPPASIVFRLLDFPFFLHPQKSRQLCRRERRDLDDLGDQAVEGDVLKPVGKRGEFESFTLDFQIQIGRL